MKFKNHFRQSLRPAVVIASLILIYTLLGFFAVPWLAERQLVNTLQQRLDVQASVEQIQFNPYTFEATVSKLQLTTDENEPLAAWDTFYLNLQPAHLFALTLRIEAINLAAPALHFQRYTASDNTLTRLADRWTANAEEVAADENEQTSETPSEPLFTLEIGVFETTDGIVHYRDDVPAETFETVLSPINIQLADFSTAAGQTASQGLVIELEDSARLTLDGSLSLSPLQLTGEAQLKDFSLQTPYRYLKGQLPFELKRGMLDLKLAYDVDMGGETTAININQVDLQLADFGIHQSGKSEAILAGGTLNISNAGYAFPENQLSIDAVALNDFKLAATQNEQGKLNWLQLMAAMPEQKADEAPADSDLAPLQLTIAKINIDNTAVTLEDERPATALNLALTLSASMQDFTLAENQKMPFSSNIRLDSGGNVALQGDLQLFPALAVTAKTDVKQLSLLPAQSYLNKYAHIEFIDGKFDASTRITVNQQESFSLKGNLGVSDLQLHNQKLDEKLLSLDKLSVNNLDFSLANLRLAIAEVNVDALDSRVVINEAGEINLAQLMKTQPSTGNEAAESDNSNGDDSPQLQLNIANINLNNTALALEDQREAAPVSLGLKLSASMQDFSLAEDQQMPFSSNIELDSGGNIALQGDLQIFPALAVTAETDIEQLSLLPAQVYLSKYAHIELVDGKFDASTRITVNDQEPFSLQGNLGLSNLQLDNQKLDEKLLSLDKLSVNNLDFSSANQQLAISELIVDALYSRVLIREGGETNLAQLMKTSAPTENDADHTDADETAESESSNGYDFSLGRVEINDASSNFTDQNLPIVFNADMQRLNGEISGFSTSSKQPVDIALEGKVDEFGLVEINGVMKPLNITDQTEIKLAFSNLDLPAMSPYTVKFAGREIAEGRGDVTLTYEIINSQLDASNDIVIRDIRLGENVESPDALDLPLDLAVALLKNSEGVIALKIPVSGDVNDPQFAMGPVIRGAISNAMGNIVSAPFRFLGGLIGGNDEQINEVRFRAGRSDLAPPEQEKLSKLVEALSQRPELALQIPAPFDETADRQSLRTSAVETRIESRLSDVDADQQLVLKRRNVLESLYTEAELSPNLQSLQQQFTATEESGEPSQGVLDVLAYNAKLKASLIEAESVTDSQLQTLAKQRQTSVVEYVKQTGELKEDQLQTSDSVATQLKDGWLSMRFELDTI